MPRRQEAWQNPDPRRALEVVRALPLNEEQMAAASSDPDLPKMIRAGTEFNAGLTLLKDIFCEKP